MRESTTPIAGSSGACHANMLAPGDLTELKRSDIVSMEPVAISNMPTGLLDSFHEEEILDLLAYLLSGGDPDAPEFRKSPGD